MTFLSECVGGAPHDLLALRKEARTFRLLRRKRFGSQVAAWPATLSGLQPVGSERHLSLSSPVAPTVRLFPSLVLHLFIRVVARSLTGLAIKLPAKPKALLL